MILQHSFWDIAAVSFDLSDTYCISFFIFKRLFQNKISLHLNPPNNHKTRINSEKTYSLPNDISDFSADLIRSILLFVNQFDEIDSIFYFIANKKQPEGCSIIDTTVLSTKSLLINNICTLWRYKIKSRCRNCCVDHNIIKTNRCCLTQ